MSPQVQDEARRLFVSLLDRPSAARRAEVAAWRQADPAHDAAFVAIEASWLATGQAAQRMAQDDAAELGVYLDAMDRAKTRKKAISLSLTVALGLFLWLQHPHLIQNLQADHVAARATREQVTLADGSSVLLDADSALSVRFSADERRVSLLRGAAFFEVTPSDVPFVVEAGDGTIRVLGTGFDVRLLDDRASVTLEHGSIALTPGKDAASVTLVAGEQADFGAQGVDVGSVVLADALAWRAGRYVFYRARLADVVHQIGRYRGGRIVIATQALAEARVTGSFALSDTDAALASLQASVGFRMTSLGGLTVIR